jgi:hypothetical protein
LFAEEVALSSSNPAIFAQCQPSLLPGCEAPAAQWLVSQLTATPKVAHHPTCRCYDNHLLRLGRFSVCLGCACLTAGGLAAAGVLAWMQTHLFFKTHSINVYEMMSLGIALYVPCLIQVYVQRKWFKIVARLSLGASIPVLWFAAMFLLPGGAAGWVLRGIFIVLFVGNWKLTQYVRRQKTCDSSSYCRNGCYPFCRDNLRRLPGLVNQLPPSSQGEIGPFVELLAGLAQGSHGSSAVSIQAYVQGCEDHEAIPLSSREGGGV